MTYSSRYKLLIIFLIFNFSPLLNAQETTLKLSEIMAGNEFIGQQPFNFTWDADSELIYFRWNKDNEQVAPFYQYDLTNKKVDKIASENLKHLPINGFFKEKNGRMRFYKKGNSIYRRNKDTDELIYRSTDLFSIHSIIENQIIILKNKNLFALNTEKSGILQLTNFVTLKEEEEFTTETYLESQQTELFQVLRTTKAKSTANTVYNKQISPVFLSPFNLKNWDLYDISITSKLDQVVFTKYIRKVNKKTEYTHYITENGYTKTITERSKVGINNPEHQLFVWNFLKDTFQRIEFIHLSNFNGIPEYYKKSSEYNKDMYYEKELIFHLHGFNEKGDKCLVEIKSYDNKDRWIGYIDMQEFVFVELEHQQDEKWIGGPGITGWNMVAGNVGWVDNSTFYYQSEESGFSHLYTCRIGSEKKTALTKGDFEIHAAELSMDKKHFYISANKNHAGNREFYKLEIASKKMIPILTEDGNHEVIISPDEKWLLVNYSYKNKPWDLYIAPNKKNTELTQITESRREAFKNYEWRKPEIISFTARDEKKISARIYEPTPESKNGAAVFFVHGAGYLQNAHNWWSVYYREFMFNNLLCDLGYTVIDVDYRASKGYGRDFRTDIYQNMGGKDLSDHIDARSFLIDNYGIDSTRIGMYGGSYGGFITLMALLKEPGKFQCGAAIRSVTDWAHYNHAYTSNILNTPEMDPEAFKRSSPIYYAENLEDRLLMLHGMVDGNVQYQDVVRLSQRFIELGKTNWDLIGYPFEPHGFKETTSWVDEYGRILKMFKEEL